jgi:hypothetical protein
MVVSCPGRAPEQRRPPSINRRSRRPDREDVEHECLSGRRRSRNSPRARSRAGRLRWGTDGIRGSAPGIRNRNRKGLRTGRDHRCPRPPRWCRRTGTRRRRGPSGRAGCRTPSCPACRIPDRDPNPLPPHEGAYTRLNTGRSGSVGRTGCPPAGCRRGPHSRRSRNRGRRSAPRNRSPRGRAAGRTRRPGWRWTHRHTRHPAARGTCRCPAAPARSCTPACNTRPSR